MKFALITEGASEHRVIRHIISRYFKEQEPEINQIQPKLVNQKQTTDGGWNEVLKYCGRDELKDILVENDYLVIQIDTDRSETKPFSVSHSKDGQAKTDEELFEDIVAKLRGLIKPEILEKHKNRILFAICIHTIECWLLPLLYSDNNKAKTYNCLDMLNKKIKDKIPRSKNSPNGIRAYNAILINIKKKTEIKDISAHNFGFKKFVEFMDTVVIE